jgi:hypothetical protein
MRGVAAWLRACRGAKIVVESNVGSGSIKLALDGIDKGAAVRITKIVHGVT